MSNAEEDTHDTTQSQTVMVTIDVHPIVHRLLEELADSGLFGLDVEEVTNRLVCDRLRDLIAEDDLGLDLEGIVNTEIQD